MVRAVVALVHLLCLRAHGQCQQLMSKADAEHRHAARHQVADHRRGVFGGGRRVARTIGEDNAVRRLGQDFFGGCARRSHRHPRADGDERAQDVAFDAIVDDHHVPTAASGGAVAVRPTPAAFLPGERRLGRGVLGEVQTLEASPGASALHESVDVEAAFGMVGDDAKRHALFANLAGQGAGIDAGEAHDPTPGEPAVQVAARPPVGRGCRRLAEDGPARGGRRAAGDLLHVLDVGPNIAHVREGEDDDLVHVRRVGEDFLIAGHGGVETHLAQRLAHGSAALADENRPVRQGKKARDAGGKFRAQSGILK